MTRWLLCFIAVLSVTTLCNCQVPSFPETCVKNAYPPVRKADDNVKTYIVNLDLPGNQRWAPVVKDKGPQIKQLLSSFKNLIRDITDKADDFIKILDEEGPTIVNSLPQPFADEMKGIATVTGLELGEIALFNIFYEIFTVCTSIVAQDSKGKMYHARNLDFGLFMGWDVKKNTWLITEFLRPMVVNIDFQKGGKTLYKSVHFAGYIGVLTGIKPGFFTLSMNERFNIDGGYIGILEWILGNRSGKWMGFLTREVMEFATSYEEAKDKLTNKEMLAPAYFILGGNKTGQGCVITRARSKAEDVWEMKKANDWYILETNYDHWEKPFILDDRRTPAHNCMKNMTQANVSFKEIYNVLSSKPVLNKLTAYTALMQVNSGALETHTRECSDPCWPW